MLRKSRNDQFQAHYQQTKFQKSDLSLNIFYELAYFEAANSISFYVFLFICKMESISI